MNKRQLAKTTEDSEILEQFSHDGDYDVRYWVAGNSNTSSETLEFLSRDRCSSVRENVARNSNTSVETLEFLSHDEDCNVRFRVAQNSNTPFETLKQMAIHEEDYYIRNLILKNPSCNNDLYMYIEGKKLLETLFQPST